MDNGIKKDVGKPTFLNAIFLHLITAFYTNGPIEGVNRKIKELKRSGYGYANQERMFRRVYQLVA